jgi:predicted DCC family thiol-disulfide oxidoreductase YuxK
VTHPEGHRRYAVIFDGECGICRRFVSRLQRWDTERSLEYLASSDATVPARFGWIPRRAFDESVQLVRIADGETWQGAGAIEELLRILPRSPRAGWLFKLPLARPIAEAAYRLFARNRARLGCEAHCRTN